MNNVFLIPITIFLLGTSNLWGQDNVLKNTLHFSVGQHQGIFEDHNFSPLHYKDKGLIYDFAYSRVRQQSLFTFALQYGAGFATTKASSEFTSEYILGDLRLQYLQFAKQPGKNKRLYLGGQYHFYINYLEWNNQASFSFLANHSLDIAARYDYDWNEKNRLIFSLDVPIINLVVRPPYNGFDEELDRNNDEGNVFRLITDGRWGSFNKLMAYAFQMQYHRQLSSRFDLNATYRNRLYKTFEINSITHFQHQFLLGIVFRF